MDDRLYLRRGILTADTCFACLIFSLSSSRYHIPYLSPAKLLRPLVWAQDEHDMHQELPQLTAYLIFFALLDFVVEECIYLEYDEPHDGLGLVKPDVYHRIYNVLPPPLTASLAWKSVSEEWRKEEEKMKQKQQKQ